MPRPAKPHYTDIARHLTEGIACGHFAVGSVLPTELELVGHYRTSRHTIRAALAELQSAGLVSRRKNVGTRVETATPRAMFRPSLASIDDLVQFGTQHRRQLRSIRLVNVTRAQAADLGCANGQRWLRISSLRVPAAEVAGQVSGAPIGWTDVYVDPAYADIGAAVRDAPDVLVSDLLQRRHGLRIAEIHQEVRALAVDDVAIAKALGLDIGAPALKVLRRYLDGAGKAFEVSVSVHPAERFAISMRLQQTSG
ncbi:MAG: GntR family transcriptional regulator [Gammaproteobacteria bacterium]|nr:GntR family transcriptional regulator [Gammaproteobacteria bacterium]MBU1440634.1 GntR family transcriptional regulator [Gammaproteobacteria bacterium]